MLPKVLNDLVGRNRFSSQLLITVGTNLLMAALGTVTGVTAARLLGPEGRGELTAIQSWPMLIAVFASLGLNKSIIYYSAKKPKQAGELLGSAVALSLLAIIPFMLLGYIIIPLLLSAQSEEVVRLSQLYLIYLPISALVGIPHSSLRGINDLASWNKIRFLPNVMWLLVLVVGFLFQKRDPGWFAFSYLILLLFLFFPIIRIVLARIQRPYRPAAKLMPSLLKYGLPSVVSDFPSILNLRLDQLIMISFLPAKTLGLYVVAVAWGNMVRPVLTAIGAVLFPRVASQESKNARNLIFAQGSRLGVTVSIPLVAGKS